jgi:hypothetical protein
VLGLTVPSSFAEEPSNKFLEKLKQAGYYDMAAVYIEQLQTDPSLSADAKLALAYEQGDVLWKQSLNTREPKARDAAIAAAQAKLAQFLKDAPKHPNASDALLSLARMADKRSANWPRNLRPTNASRKWPPRGLNWPRPRSTSRRPKNKPSSS